MKEKTKVSKDEYVPARMDGEDDGGYTNVTDGHFQVEGPFSFEPER
jgi:hypothetical protein